MKAWRWSAEGSKRKDWNMWADGQHKKRDGFQRFLGDGLRKRREEKGDGRGGEKTVA